MEQKYVVIEFRGDNGGKYEIARYYFDNYADAISFRDIIADKKNGRLAAIAPFFISNKKGKKKDVKKGEVPKKYEKLIYFALSLGAIIGFISIMAFTWACIRILWRLV